MRVCGWLVPNVELIKIWCEIKMEYRLFSSINGWNVGQYVSIALNWYVIIQMKHYGNKYYVAKRNMYLQIQYLKRIWLSIRIEWNQFHVTISSMTALLRTIPLKYICIQTSINGRLLVSEQPIWKLINELQNVTKYQ